MSTWRMHSSIVMRPPWSMPCSTNWRGSCAKRNFDWRQAGAGGRMTPGDIDASEESAEDRIIARYFKPLARHPGAFGLIDDAAVLTPPAGHDLVLKTDPIICGVHFFPE